MVYYIVPENINSITRANKILNNDNMIVTAHIGSLAKEARQNMEAEAAENLLQGLINVGLIQR